MSGDIGIRKVFIKTYVTDIKLEYGYTTFDSEMYYFTLKYKDAKKKFDEYVELIGNQKNAIDVIDLFINDKKKRIEEKNCKNINLGIYNYKINVIIYCDTQKYML